MQKLFKFASYFTLQQTTEKTLWHFSLTQREHSLLFSKCLYDKKYEKKLDRNGIQDGNEVVMLLFQHFNGFKYNRYESCVSITKHFHGDVSKTTEISSRVLKRISSIAYSSAISLWPEREHNQCTQKCYHTSPFRESKGR